jgi:Protein of unknown function (DUF1569)
MQTFCMKNLFQTDTAAEVKERIAGLTPNSPRLWGKMSAGQAVAHCCVSMKWALGEIVPPRMFVGRVIGGVIKPLVLGDDKPMRRNSPTAPTLIVQDERDLAVEKQRLSHLLDRFVEDGPQAFAVRPHCFFGKLTPDEWAILMYKHLDHHLRQFSA